MPDRRPAPRSPRPRRPGRRPGRRGRRPISAGRPAFRSRPTSAPRFRSCSSRSRFSSRSRRRLQRLVDRFGRGCQAALQDGQGEADGSLAAFVFQGLGPVEFLADVVGDLLVEFGLGVGKGVIDRVGEALREERRAVELEQLLLDQPAHHVARRRRRGRRRGTCPRSGRRRARP